MLGLLSVLFAILILVLDGTLMNVAMVNVAADLKISLSDLQTLITFYSLVMGALMLLGGKLADVLGRKKIFMLGVAMFGIGSLISALSSKSWQLLLGWSVIEGIGAALMMPASTSLIVDSFKGKKRALAFGLWGGIAAAGAALGPVVGGYITTYYSWRYAFLMQVVVAVFVLIGAFKLRENAPLKGTKIDFIGALLSGLAVTSIIYASLKAWEYGWFKAKRVVEIAGINLAFFNISLTFWLMVVGIILLLLFVVWQRRCKYPLLNLEIFRNWDFTSAIVFVTVLNLAQAGLFFVLPIYFQVLFNLTPLKVGLYLLPITIGVLLTSAIGSRWSRSSKFTIVLGLILSLIAGVILFNIIDTKLEYTKFVPVFILLGAGLGFVMSQITNVIMSAVPAKYAGEASGVNSTLRRIGSSLGTALVGTVFFSYTEDKLRPLASTLHLPSLDVRIVAEVIRHLPAAVSSKLFDDFAIIVVDGIKRVSIFTIAILLLVVIWALFVPLKVENHDRS